jgi:hypothetical protein
LITTRKRVADKSLAQVPYTPIAVQRRWPFDCASVMEHESRIVLGDKGALWPQAQTYPRLGPKIGIGW